MSKYSAHGAAWDAQRLRVLDRDGWTCAYCGKHLEGADATADHIDPLAAMDEEAREDVQDHDLVAACRKCNGTKADRTAVRVDYAAPRWLPRGLPI